MSLIEMNRKVAKAFFALITLFFIGCAALYIWICLPRPRISEAPITRDEFIEHFMSKDTPQPKVLHCLAVSSAASNILYASSSAGLGGRAFCCRYNAPVSNMLQQLIHIEKSITSHGVYEKVQLHEPVFLPVSKPRLSVYGLKEMEWFDVDNIKTGYISHVAGRNSTIWIDSERELLYYWWSD